MLDEENSVQRRKIRETANINLFELMHSRLREVTEFDKRRLGIVGGVKVTARLSGKLAERTNMCPGFVITVVDHIEIYTLEDFAEAIENKSGVMLQGVYPDGYVDHYYLELS
ncbi:hypothetical protein FNH22_09160 [Fulvivirga sp. M361]|uniref:hypothetical protein n=1 Tax=Fulvivirga sp. M361 TaxID=2594266 RepID=UPI001179E091|nr:hypothetical protein [Fulvivirga sp. M361]TRX60206.1 hypothetical protein FNH22_09160 [Fulvivirga sp. M361]